MALALASCSYDYNKGDIADALDENTPDMSIEQASLTFVRGTTILMNAQRIDLYSGRKTQEMSDIDFAEVDRSNAVRTSGAAKYAVVETDTNNVTIAGDFSALSKKDNATIVTKYLRWDDAKRRIEGSPTEEVVVTRGDGSQISGYGFLGDAKERTLSMTQSVQGQLVVDENK